MTLQIKVEHQLSIISMTESISMTFSFHITSFQSIFFSPASFTFLLWSFTSNTGSLELMSIKNKTGLNSIEVQLSHTLFLVLSCSTLWSQVSRTSLSFQLHRAADVMESFQYLHIYCYWHYSQRSKFQKKATHKKVVSAFNWTADEYEII